MLGAAAAFAENGVRLSGIHVKISLFVDVPMKMNEGMGKLSTHSHALCKARMHAACQGYCLCNTVLTSTIAVPLKKLPAIVKNG